MAQIFMHFCGEQWSYWDFFGLRIRELAVKIRLFCSTDAGFAAATTAAKKISKKSKKPGTKSETLCLKGRNQLRPYPSQSPSPGGDFILS